MDRVLAGLVAVVMALLAAGCGGEDGLDCPSAGEGGNDAYLIVNVVNLEPSLRTKLATIRLELCQAGRCRTITFPRRAANEDTGILRKGVSEAGRRRITIALSAFPGQWDPDAAVRVDFRGRAASGGLVVRHAESFTFRHIYPYGKECDPTFIRRHTMYVGPDDLVRSPT